MYLPKHFAPPDVNQMHRLMHEHPLATLIVVSADGVEANHLPLLLSADGRHLHGHMARSNPLVEADGAAVLVVFQGPHAYISPSWYPSRPARAVPTWNYAVVHAHGRLTCRDQADWMQHHLAVISQRFESRQDDSWQMHAAPEDFLQRMQSAVVGIDIAIERLEGKFKLSQNRSAEDRWGVIEALNASAGGRHPLSRWMWVGTEQG